jgi:hypothetical protein
MQNQFIEIPVTQSFIENRNLIYSVGINDADYQVKPLVGGIRLVCPFYTKWQGMMHRCFSEKFQEKHPTYKGCSVCDEWLIFSNFKAWMLTQDWEGMELDKDIINPENKIYSPDNCCFVPQKLNKLLNDFAAGRGELPRGVCFCKQTGRYQAHVCIGGKAKKLGRHDTIKQASAAYVKAKVSLILKAANEQSDRRIANGLRLHAELLKRNA